MSQKIATPRGVICFVTGFWSHLLVSTYDNGFTARVKQPFLGCGLINTFIIIERLECVTSQFVVGKIVLVFIVVVRFGEICVKFLSYGSCRIPEHCSVINLKCALN